MANVGEKIRKLFLNESKFAQQRGFYGKSEISIYDGTISQQ